MVGMKNFVSWGLLASFSQLGNSRALPGALQRCGHGTCNNDFTYWLAPRKVALGLKPRLDDTQDHSFDGFTKNWIRQDDTPHSVHEARAFAPLRWGPKPVTPVDPTKPNTGSGTGTGLDPSNPNGTPKDTSKDPSPGLDPTKPDGGKPKDPVDRGPGLDPSKPKDTLGGSCKNKRADEPCIRRGSDSDGDDVPGQPTEDTFPSSGSHDPADDEFTRYNYLDDVQTDLAAGFAVSPKLATLAQRIEKNAKDQSVRSGEIESQFTRGREKSLYSAEDIKKNPSLGVHDYDSIFDFNLGHTDVERLFNHPDVKSKFTMADFRGKRDYLYVGGAGERTLQWSWSGDGKVLFKDWSFKDFDISTMSPKAHHSELSRVLFEKNKIEPKNVQAVVKSEIINLASTFTINAIFKTFFGESKSETMLILRSTGGSDKESRGFNAYFRTQNGKGTANLLAYNQETFGGKQPDTLILQRPGPGEGDPSTFNSIVLLK